MKKTLNIIKDYIAHYLKLRFTAIRLEVIECVSKVMGYFMVISVVGFFVFLALLYFSFGLSVWLTEIFHSRFQGLLCTGGILLLIAFLLLLFIKPFIRLFAGKIAASMWASHKKNKGKGA